MAGLWEAVMAEIVAVVKVALTAVSMVA